MQIKQKEFLRHSPIDLENNLKHSQQLSQKVSLSSFSIIVWLNTVYPNTFLKETS